MTAERQTTERLREARALLADLIERWHVWNAASNEDGITKVMLGIRLMQEVFDALPNLEALAAAPVDRDGLREAQRLNEEWLAEALRLALARFGGYAAPNPLLVAEIATQYAALSAPKQPEDQP